MLAVASCKAGVLSNNYSGSSESNSASEGGSSEGHDYSAPSAPSTHNFAAQSQGHDYLGQAHQFTGNQGQGHNFGISQNQGHNFGGSQDYNFGGHQFAGQNHDFSGGQGQKFDGGKGGDISYHLNQIHGIGHNGHAFPSFQQFQSLQPRGFDVSGFGGHSGFDASPNNFHGDSYLQAAQELGSFDHGAHGLDGGQEEYQQSASEEQGDHSVEYVDPSGQQGHEQQNSKQWEGNFQHMILQDAGNEFGHGDIHHSVGDDGHDLQTQSFPVGEHVDVQNPVGVPLYKHVTYPVAKIIHVNVPKPILVGVPQPYPVKVPVHKPVAVPVETEISIPIEKVVPYPVVKHVPYPVEKHVPIKVEKTVTVHVPQPYPVKIPVYKTIHHHKEH